LPFFPDPRATAPTRCNFRPSDHPAPPFNQEQKCTDGSTDANIFAPSVHLTLYKSVGPTRHNGSTSSSSSLTLTLRRRRPAPDAAAFVLTSGKISRARASSAVIRVRRRLLALAAGRRASPPRPNPRVRAAATHLGFRRRRQFRPPAAVSARQRPPRRSVRPQLSTTAAHWRPFLRCG
jgi:hypothetical protein